MQNSCPVGQLRNQGKMGKGIGWFILLCRSELASGKGMTREQKSESPWNSMGEKGTEK